MPVRDTLYEHCLYPLRTEHEVISTGEEIAKRQIACLTHQLDESNPILTSIADAGQLQVFVRSLFVRLKFAGKQAQMKRMRNWSSNMPSHKEIWRLRGQPWKNLYLSPRSMRAHVGFLLMPI
jgi:hypothetical protein